MLSEDTTDCLALSNTATLMRLIEELAEPGAVARYRQNLQARGSMMPFSSSVESSGPGSRRQQGRLIQ